MAFRDYEQVMLRHLWKIDETIAGWREDRAEAGSRELTGVVNRELPPPGSTSPNRRASIINAANRFVDNGIWGYHEVTGKGGYRKLYYAIMTEYDLWKAIKSLVLEKITPFEKIPQ